MNKLNQIIAESSHRNPDDLSAKPFNEWCSIAQYALELADERKPKKKK